MVKPVFLADLTPLQFSRLSIEEKIAFYFDVERERVALLWWSARLASWIIHAAGESRRRNDLERMGCLLFGAPPWRRACIISAVGGLGSVEDAAAGLAAPGPDFVFDFPFDGWGDAVASSDEASKPVRRVVKPVPKGQGSLF